MGMVTKLLNRNDPEYHTDAAKAAIDAEIRKLIVAGVWDEKPISKYDAERLHPDDTFFSYLLDFGDKGRGVSHQI